MSNFHTATEAETVAAVADAHSRGRTAADLIERAEVLENLGVYHEADAQYEAAKRLTAN